MPVISMDTTKLTNEQKKELIKKFTEIAMKITNFPLQAFIVIIKEHAGENIGVEGISLNEFLDKRTKEER